MYKNRSWHIIPKMPQEDSDALSAFPPLAAQLLHNRGVRDAQAAELFLARDNRLLENPYLLPDITVAVTRLVNARAIAEPIGVFGDFDADGITGTALMADGLENIGCKVIPYIPDRVNEGHGLNMAAINHFKHQGVKVIVTVDCGITSDREVRMANSMGIDTIITDHHLPISVIPDAIAVVNPKLEHASYPFSGLSGAGLAFKLIQALYIELGLDWDESLLQLAAVGTITDITPMIKENRFIVARGLASMDSNPKPGFAKLLQTSGNRSTTLDTESISFSIGPRINAASRVGSPMVSYDLLRAPSLEVAAPLAKELESFNRRRRGITDEAMRVASEQVDMQIAEEKILVIASEQFHPGVIGLIASRLVEDYYRPAVVIALDQEIGRASARSIPEFNIAAAIQESQDLFIQYGGHAQAAGFIIPRANLSKLKNRLRNKARLELMEVALQPSISIDAHVRLRTLSGTNFKFIQDLAPYGLYNPTPVFITKGVIVKESVKIGKDGRHLKLVVAHQGGLWDAVAFNHPDVQPKKDALLDIVYKIELGTGNGSGRIRLVIEDYRVNETD